MTFALLSSSAGLSRLIVDMDRNHFANDIWPMTSGHRMVDAPICTTHMWDDAGALMRGWDNVAVSSIPADQMLHKAAGQEQSEGLGRCLYASPIAALACPVIAM